MKLVKYPLLLIWLAIFTSCGKDEIDISPPLLSKVPVDFSQLDTGIAFGQELAVGKKSPAFEYVISNPNVLVLASSRGYVEAIVINEGIPDYEVRVRPSLKSSWLLIYDHLLDVTVSEGETIMPGTTLGKVGVANRTELQLNNGNGDNTISYCPLNYGTSAFVAKHSAFMTSWCLEDTIMP